MDTKLYARVTLQKNEKKKKIKTEKENLKGYVTK